LIAPQHPLSSIGKDWRQNRPEKRIVGHEPTVHIVDADAAARQDLAARVTALCWKVRLHNSPEQLLDAIDPQQPQCVLLGEPAAAAVPLERLEQLAGEKSHPPIIVLSARGDAPTIVRALRAGALNFLQRPCDEEQLAMAIHEAFEHDAVNRRRLAAQATLQRRLSRLTRGERQVLEMLVDGHSNRAMAATLGLSVRAIEVRRAKLMQKMRAQSLAELVRMAVERGEE
jgi:two-component system, LuxR family, response regulator FixJ